MVTPNETPIKNQIDFIAECLEKTRGEVYCLLERKQKRSAYYARKHLSEIIKSAKTLRKELLAYKKAMPVKKQKSKK